MKPSSHHRYTTRKTKRMLAHRWGGVRFLTAEVLSLDKHEKKQKMFRTWGMALLVLGLVAGIWVCLLLLMYWLAS